jgi:predicted nucleic acid-binding Zn ribbon protein
MERRKTIRLRNVMQLFWRENPELYHKMLEARVQRLWRDLFGPSIARYTTNTYIKNRVLYVSMSSSVARNEMASMSKRIVAELNKHAGSDVIDDVMIR